MEEEHEEGLYMISVAARLADVHPQTLRLYERKGLLCPQRTPKNRRCYSDSDIERLKRIKELTQQEGLNLSGVSKVLAMEGEMEHLRSRIVELESRLAEFQRSVQEQVEEFKRQSALAKKSVTGLAVSRRLIRKK